MGSYYYLAAQLPYLIYGQTPPMSSEAFKELAKPILSKRDAALLDTVSLELPTPESAPDEENSAPTASCAEKAPSTGSDFIDKWREWERALRLNLARQRSVKLGRNRETPAKLPDNAPDDAAAAAAKAVSATESPLEVEFFLDKARWSAIEVLQGNSYFNRNTIFAYLLKILILERRLALKTEIGFTEYKSHYASIMENAQLSAAGEYT